ncbi:unnamed protein product [Citrullus colocynthis]|uniref:Uncharacterized protein n=1 Tax=Citrullus colocynthis TaxID=252529 RepID=A0ABP0YG19_9ROSI
MGWLLPRGGCVPGQCSAAGLSRFFLPQWPAACHDRRVYLNANPFTGARVPSDLPFTTDPMSSLPSKTSGTPPLPRHSRQL